MQNHVWNADFVCVCVYVHVCVWYAQIKARLGGRIRLMVSGGAPLSTEVEEFMRVTGCAFFTQGYGKINNFYLVWK